MTHFEFQTAFRKYSERCSEIAASRNAAGDKLAAIDFLIESIASFEAAKMVVLMPLEMVPSFLHSLSPNSPSARVARRKALRQPRPRPASPQYLHRLAARLRAVDSQQTPNESTPRP